MKHETKFKRELDLFRSEIELGLRPFYSYLAYHAVANKDKTLLSKLNKTPLFWGTTIYSLQCTYFIVLGRIFDTASKHNVHRLISYLHQDPDIFSKKALRKRKRTESPNAEEWINDFMSSAYEPTVNDFRFIRKDKAKQTKLYKTKIEPIRHKVFAHKEFLDIKDTQKLFVGVKVGEVKSLYMYLSELHEALWQLYMNGEKPVLKKQPHDVKKILKMELVAHTSHTLQEMVVKDTQRHLESL